MTQGTNQRSHQSFLVLTEKQSKRPSLVSSLLIPLLAGNHDQACGVLWEPVHLIRPCACEPMGSSTTCLPLLALAVILDLTTLRPWTYVNTQNGNTYTVSSLPKLSSSIPRNSHSGRSPDPSSQASQPGPVLVRGYSGRSSALLTARSQPISSMRLSSNLRMWPRTPKAFEPGKPRRIHVDCCGAARALGPGSIVLQTGESLTESAYTN